MDLLKVPEEKKKVVIGSAISHLVYKRESLVTSKVTYKSDHVLSILLESGQISFLTAPSDTGRCIHFLGVP